MNLEKSDNKNSTITVYTITYIVIFILFFIVSVFFNDKGKMVYPRYVPENSKIGNDLYIDYGFSARYFVDHKSAYISDDPVNWYAGNPYPPMFTYFMAPIFWFNIPKETVYYFLATSVLVLFLISCLILPWIYQKNKKITTGMLFVALTGISSYGLQFTLERGQFDLIAIFFALLAVYVFWFFPKQRWLAYVLIVVAFQYKIYPIYLVICFIDDIKHPKKSILRVVGICTACFASLFCMGWQGFLEFLRSLTSQKSLGYIRDHGIFNGPSYVLKVLGFDFEAKSTIIVASILLLICVGGFYLLVRNYLKKENRIGFYPPLLLWATVAAMALFPSSKDYKLIIIFGAMSVYLIYIEKAVRYVLDSKKILFYTVFSLEMICYCCCLFSYAYRPEIIQNSFPFLYIILLTIPLMEMCFSKIVLPEPEMGKGLQPAAGG